jgi:transposase
MYAPRVLDLVRETDVERLRQMALLLEAENARLHQRLVALTRELAEARGEDRAQLELELQHLTEQLAARNRQLFGDPSERRGRGPRDQPAAREKTRGHGPREQPTLPLVEVTHTLDPADQVCPQCGGDLRPWEGQTEDAEEIDVVERSFRLVRHRRQKYRCGCGSCIDTALGPPKLIPGGRYSVDFAVAVAVGKYLDHLPLARQVRQMARAGLRVDTQTLWDQLNALERHLAPTYAALGAYVRAAPVLGADETTWTLMTPGKSKTWWVWSLTRPDAVLYELAPSRSGATARTVLGDFGGIVLCDGYGAYRALTTASDRAGPTVTLAHCWAHARRYFVEAEPHYPAVRQVLDLIGTLYAADAAAHATAAGDATVLVAQRQATVAPIVAAIRAWLTTQAALPRSALGKAIGYALTLWPGLIAFLAHAGIPLDNNATERALRGVAVGRKNHYGSRSERGTRVAAVCYSLLESAKLAGLEPAAYLAEATRRAIATPGTVTLPRDLLAERAA